MSKAPHDYPDNGDKGYEGIMLNLLEGEVSKSRRWLWGILAGGIISVVGGGGFLVNANLERRAEASKTDIKQISDDVIAGKIPSDLLEKCQKTGVVKVSRNIDQYSFFGKNPFYTLHKIHTDNNIKICIKEAKPELDLPPLR